MNAEYNSRVNIFTNKYGGTQKPLLMVSGSMHNADMYYATHFLAVDPFIYLRVPHEGKDILIVSQMEYERATITSEERQVEAKINLPFNRRCKRPQR